MRVQATQDIERPGSRTIPEGRIFTVTNEYGRELIERGVAVILPDDPVDYPTDSKDSTVPLATDEEE
jgi:hypothetical protein